MTHEKGKSIARTHLEVSTLVPFIHIVTAVKTWLKISWICVVIAMMVVFGWYSAQCVFKFLAQPVGTNIIIYANPLEFPAVSFCNMNPYKASALEKSAPKVLEAISNYTELLINKSTAKIRKKRDDPINQEKQEVEEMDYSHLHDENALIERVRRRRSPALGTEIIDNVGTKFYTTFIPNIIPGGTFGDVGPANQQLFLSTDSVTTFPVLVQASPGSGMKAFVHNINYTDVAQVVIKTSISNAGIKLSGDYPFTVYSMHMDDASAGGFLVFPTRALGTDYLVITPEADSLNNYINIVGTVDNTTIMIKRTDGSMENLTIDEMQVKRVISPDDLSGTRITADQPIAVISGHNRTRIPAGCTAYDQVIEQLPPVYTLGTRFPLAPFQHIGQCGGTIPPCCTNRTLCDKCYEFYKVVALLKNTFVQRHGTVSNENFTLEAGETRYVLALQTEYSYMLANKPLIVAQFMPGDSYQSGNSDESMVIVPPIEGYGSKYRFTSCMPGFTAHYLNVIIDRRKFVGLFLNGLNITANHPYVTSVIGKAIPQTAYNAYQILLTCGSDGPARDFAMRHTDVTVTFGVFCYGVGFHISYAYMAGARLETSSFFCVPSPDTNPPDLIDNDCDGQKEEELRNWIDDDGDGLIDEDLATDIPMISFNQSVEQQDQQTYICNSSGELIPKNCKAPIQVIWNVTTDPRCTQLNLTYTDELIWNSSCQAMFRRVWHLMDGCGNLDNDTYQTITVNRELVYNTTQWAPLCCNKTNESNPPDGLDNDCDGYKDEELRNFIDDDHDGLIDEDLHYAIPDITLDTNIWPISQSLLCNTSGQLIPKNCIAPIRADWSINNIDPRCVPAKITFQDQILWSENCTAMFNRVWHLADKCGNLVKDTIQLIMVTRELVYNSTKWAPLCCNKTNDSPPDGLDNDCDGYKDEELRNFMDDDGDGLIDEDLHYSIPILTLDETQSSQQQSFICNTSGELVPGNCRAPDMAIWITQNDPRCSPVIITHTDQLVWNASCTAVFSRMWKMVDACGNIANNATQTITVTRDLLENSTKWAPLCCNKTDQVNPPDGLDNDCDGYKDEELRNFLDDDGDGLVDEDVRYMIPKLIFDPSASTVQPFKCNTSGELIPLNCKAPDTAVWSNQIDPGCAPEQITFRDILIWNTSCQAMFTRTWTMKDSCGNVANETNQTITVSRELLENSTKWAPMCCNKTQDSNPPDGLDNDCDGYIDEEVRNYIDDDGDGLVDEDLRYMIPEIAMDSSTTPQSQSFKCNSSSDLTPEYCIAPVQANWVKNIDPSCSPEKIDFEDQLEWNTSCQAQFKRIWHVGDNCGNILPDIYQSISITRELLLNSTQWAPLCCNKTDGNVPDGSDNDCDGYVDEELRNFLDDDGDGLVDEDLKFKAPILEMDQSQLSQPQLYNCSTAYELIPENCLAPENMVWTANVDPACDPAKISFKDILIWNSTCAARFNRIWQLEDACGNYANQSMQVISVTRVLTPNSTYTKACCNRTSDSNPPDQIDNDCDGMVDEELRNFIDDDGDGLVDEDLKQAIPKATLQNPESSQTQMYQCNTTDELTPENCQAPITANFSIDVDPKCQPASTSYQDELTINGSCKAIFTRSWQSSDSCGNLATDTVQTITVTRIMQDNSSWALTCCNKADDQNPPDHLDNDCDGKIDEEIRNFLDDDGDGLVDEDLGYQIPSISMNGTESMQKFLCNTTGDLRPEKCVAPALVNFSIDPKCGQPNSTFQDVIVSSAKCNAIFSRQWNLIDSCGNLGNYSQLISVMKAVDPKIWPSPCIIGQADDHLALATELEEAMPYLIQSVGAEKLAELAGYSLEDMLFACRYDGRPCDRKTEIKKFLDPNYGNCFTFNLDPGTHMAHQAGAPRGLQLIFKMRSDEYMPYILTSGFKLLIQNQTEPRIMQTLGVGCSAGSTYSFAIERTTVTKLGWPYGQCVDDPSKTLNYYTDGYSLEACIKSCYQSRVMQKCNCADPHVPSTEPCVDSVAESELSYASCNCYQPCESAIFSYTQTKLDWPTPATADAICKQIYATDLEQCIMGVKQSYGRVDIYYDILRSNMFEEYAQYTWPQLLADLSGHGGLWLSLSVISIIELIFLPFALIYDRASC